jgi:hypothetical protein
VASGEAKGEKEIRVTVVNKSGWLTVGSAKLEVRIDPVIVQTNVWPKQVDAGRSSKVTLYIQIENPGRITDVTSVAADLRNLDGPVSRLFYNDGTAGDETAGDDIFTLQFVVPESVGAGERKIPVVVSNRFGGRTRAELILRVR